ncbi:MAG TPA: ABC transporter substrate-binding protein, partial [Actinopolymorphaceae bacterium]
MAFATRRRLVGGIAALACAIAAALPLTGSTAHAQSGEEKDSLVVAVSQSVKSFNPFTLFFSIDFTVTGLAYDSLIDWSAKDFSPIPAIATEWKESDDHLTWTYTIREGVKFSDGKPLTAKDVAFTYHTMMTNEDARAANAELVDNFVSVDAPDDKTFVVELKQPSNQMLALDTPIVPEHIWKDRLDNLGADLNFDFPLVGSGPFQVTEFKKDQFIRFAANKDYWGGAPKYDELVFRYFKTPDAAVQALEAGEVDVVSGLTPAQYKSLQGKDGITVNQGPGRRVHSITFNVGAQTQSGEKFGDGHPALQDVRVRRA